MKIYLGLSPDDPKNYKNFERVLISYHYFKKKYDEVKDLIKPYDLFVDSGAFSAFTQEKQIDLEDYMQWIKKNKFKEYAALDVIYDPEQTKKNFEYMKECGLKPIPTFHYNDKLKNIQQVRAQMEWLFNEPHIALGGLVPLAKDKKTITNWLDACFANLYPYVEKGMKVHGFGVLAPDLLRRYPWYSVDGTSWIQGGKYGETVQFDGMRMKRTNNALTESLRLTRDYKAMNAKTIDEFKKLEKEVTGLWSSRGIKFDE